MRGLDDAQDVALVGLDRRVGRGRGGGDVGPSGQAVGRNLPLIAGDTGVAVVERAVTAVSSRAFLRGAADRRRRGEGQGDVGHRQGRRAGRGRVGAAVAVVRRLDDAQELALVGLDRRVGRGRGGGDVGPAGRAVGRNLPLIAGHVRVAVVERAVTAVSAVPSCAVPVIVAAEVKARVMSATARVAALVEVVFGPPSLSCAVSTTRRNWPSSVSIGV